MMANWTLRTTPIYSSCCIHVKTRTLNVLTFDLWGLQKPQLKVNVPSGTIVITRLKSLEASVLTNCELSQQKTDKFMCGVELSGNQMFTVSLVSLFSWIHKHDVRKARFSSSQETMTTSKHSATCSQNNVRYYSFLQNFGGKKNRCVENETAESVNYVWDEIENK
jgi:hypothetical protein